MPAFSQSPKVTVPRERHQQLIEIRDHFGFDSLSEAIREMIVVFRKSRKVPHSIPGIEMNLLIDGIVVIFDDQPHVTFSFEAVKAFADAVDEYLAQPGPRKTRLISLDHGFDIGGFGRAVSLKFLSGTVSKQVAPDVAREFADLMRKTISHRSS